MLQLSNNGRNDCGLNPWSFMEMRSKVGSPGVKIWQLCRMEVFRITFTFQI